MTSGPEIGHKSSPLPRRLRRREVFSPKRAGLKGKTPQRPLADIPSSGNPLDDRRPLPLEHRDNAVRNLPRCKATDVELRVEEVNLQCLPRSHTGPMCKTTRSSDALGPKHPPHPYRCQSRCGRCAPVPPKTAGSARRRPNHHIVRFVSTPMPPTGCIRNVLALGHGANAQNGPRAANETPARPDG